MPKFESVNEIVDVLAAPLGEVIASVGRSIAEAQHAMDAQTLDNFRAIYQEGAAEFAELRSIGYQPTWYHIPEVTAQIAIALTVSGSRDENTGSSPQRLRVYGTPVDAAYQSKFNYGLQASSSLKFRVVPVPPPQAVNGIRITPDLSGMTLAEARRRVEALGIELSVSAEADENATVREQRPPAGAILPAEAVLTIATTAPKSNP